MRYHPYVKYVSVSPDVVDLFENLSSWLEEDDNYFEHKCNFLRYLTLVSPNFSTFVQYSGESKERKCRPSRAVIGGFPLPFSAIQYIIDSCPYIFDKPSLIYFLNSVGVKFQDRPLSPRFFLGQSFDFRLRPVNPVYLGSKRDFSSIDKFLSKRPKFREHFIELLSKGSFDA